MGEVFGGVSPTFILNAGALGLVLMILFSLFVALRKGELYTKSAVEKIETAGRDRAKRAEEREDQWRDIALKWEATAKLSTEHTGKLLEQVNLTVDLLRAIRDAQVQTSWNGFESSSYPTARHRDRGQ